jgi:hypothetical protein
MKPSGKYMMEDLHNSWRCTCGNEILPCARLDRWQIALTVTGKTIAENLAEVPEMDLKPKNYIPG